MSNYGFGKQRHTLRVKRPGDPAVSIHHFDFLRDVTESQAIEEAKKRGFIVIPPTYTAMFDANSASWCVFTEYPGEVTCEFYSKADSEHDAVEFAHSMNKLLMGARHG